MSLTSFSHCLPSCSYLTRLSHAIVFTANVSKRDILIILSKHGFDKIDFITYCCRENIKVRHGQTVPVTQLGLDEFV